MRQAANGLQLPYISPIRLGWFTDSNIPQYMTTASPHPTDAGHEYIATRLIAALGG